MERNLGSFFHSYLVVLKLSCVSHCDSDMCGISIGVWKLHMHVGREPELEKTVNIIYPAHPPITTSPAL